VPRRLAGRVDSDGVGVTTCARSAIADDIIAKTTRVRMVTGSAALSRRTRRLIAAETNPTSDDFIRRRAGELEPDPVLLIKIDPGRN
jgi:hypothetical protein